jgi:putative transposase
MRTSRFSPEQIIRALREAEAGRPVAELCRQLNVAEATFYRWKKQFGEIGVAEVRELRDEDKELKQVVADLTLDKPILREALGNKF